MNIFTPAVKRSQLIDNETFNKLSSLFTPSNITTIDTLH
jgi:hypothetical protein